MDWLILVKIAIVYFAILLLMKFMGKREIGQLSLFDFVIILVIADIAVIGIENTDPPFYVHLLGIFLLGLIQKVLAKVMLRWAALRSFFDGKDSPIIIEGKINIKEMKKQSYNIDDLITQLRLKNIKSLSEVRYAILEANGEISVFKKDEFASSSEVEPNTNTKTVSPVTNLKTSELKKQQKNQGSNQKQEIFPFPLIVSGKINGRNLQLLRLSESWLLKEIRKAGFKSVEDIYYANYENGKLFIVQTCHF
ncbi:MAG TPA: DUF421 domain-containing protein [Acholeplasmataceae bacterium]|nr:DUF421 domain-containing protein [Acholeplasmataceae bacterium]